MGLTIKTVSPEHEAEATGKKQGLAGFAIQLDPERRLRELVSQQGDELKTHPVFKAYQRYKEWQRQLGVLRHSVAELLDKASPESHWVFVEPLRHMISEWEREPGSLFYPLETDVSLLKLDDGLLLPLSWNVNDLMLNHQGQLDVLLLRNDLYHLDKWQLELTERLGDLAAAIRREQVRQANRSAAKTPLRSDVIDVATQLVAI